jgi:hypothetical protein
MFTIPLRPLGSSRRKRERERERESSRTEVPEACSPVASCTEVQDGENLEGQVTKRCRRERELAAGGRKEGNTTGK